MKKTLLIFSCICFSGMALADNPPKIGYPWNCGCSWNKTNQSILLKNGDQDIYDTNTLCDGRNATNPCTPSPPIVIRPDGYNRGCTSTKLATDNTSLAVDGYNGGTYITCKQRNNDTDFYYLLWCNGGQWIGNTPANKPDFSTVWCCRAHGHKAECT